MTDKLPPNLLQLFTARPPLRYFPPADVAPEKRKTAIVSGLAAFLSAFDAIDDEYVPTDTAEQAKEKRREAKLGRNEKYLREGIEKYDPKSDQQARGDPYCTLFVSRLSYDTTEHDLEREFGRFGPVERIRIVRSRDTNKHTGYAFIVFEHERDMKSAYKQSEGLKIRDRLVMVDVERGRTVKGWRPTRLGGGLGGRGYTKDTIRSRYDSRGGRDRGEYRPRGYRTERDDRGEYRGGRGGYRGGYGDRGPGGGDRGPGGGGDRRGYRGGRGGGGFRSGGGDSSRGRYGGIGYRGGGFENNNHAGPPTGPSGDFPPNAPTGPSGSGHGKYGGGGYASGTNNVPVGGGSAAGGFPSGGFGPDPRGSGGRGVDEGSRRRYDDNRDYHRSGGPREYDREGERRTSHRRDYDEISRGDERDGHRHDRDRDRDRDSKRRRY